MRRLKVCAGIYLLAATTVLSPASAWGQDLIFSSDDDDDEELLLDGNGPDVEDVIERLRALQGDSVPGGDANGDGRVNLVDPIYLLNWIFRDGPAPAPLSCALPPGETTAGPYRFTRVGLRIEVNETEGTAQLALGAGANEGLRSLTVHDPSNRKILDLRSTDGRELGLEKTLLECRDATFDGVRRAYPEGAYLFQGVTVSGTHLAGEAELTHDLPPAPLFTHQLGDRHLTVYWEPSTEATSYWLEIDQDDTGFHLRVALNVAHGSYSIPTEVLVAGRVHDLSLTAGSLGGNRITMESSVVIPPPSQRAAANE